jgi:thioredoxin 1
MPTEITAPLHFKTLLNSHTYLIADFYATWCPPCKMIAPVYEQLSKANTADKKFAFVKINVDEQRDLAAQYGIQAMPTFLLFKDGKVVETIKGANPPAIKKAVEGAAKDIASAPVTNQAEKQEEVKKSTEGLSMAERLGIKFG